MRVYRSKISRSIHRTATDLHRGGLFSDAKMKEFDESCLIPFFGPQEIRLLREREAISRENLADELNIPVGLVEQWENGGRSLTFLRSNSSTSSGARASKPHTSDPLNPTARRIGPCSP